MICTPSGLEVLVETHNLTELEVGPPGLVQTGVNNRTPKVTFGDRPPYSAFELATFLNKNRLDISESAIATLQQMRACWVLYFNGILLGQPS